MKIKRFTLTELLMAIGIIVILAAIAIPTTSGAIKKAETAKAQAEMTTLVNALSNYESTYGILPVKCVDNKDGEVTNYETLIRILQGENLQVNSKNMNPRKISFLDVQGNTAGQFLDPWDNDYIIIMDGKGDGKITIGTGAAPKPHGLDVGDTIHKSIVIWSKGPDGKSSDTLDNESNADNVYSIPVVWDKGEKAWSADTH